jgi:hypothetical protein
MLHATCTHTFLCSLQTMPIRDRSSAATLRCIDRDGWIEARRDREKGRSLHALHWTSIHCHQRNFQNLPIVRTDQIVSPHGYSLCPLSHHSHSLTKHARARTPTCPPFCSDENGNFGFMQWGYCNCWIATGTPPTFPPPSFQPTNAPTHPPTFAPTTGAPTTMAPTIVGETRNPTSPPSPPPPERVPAPPPPPGTSGRQTDRKSGGNGAVVGILTVLCASGLFAFLFVSHRNGNLKNWIDQANDYVAENW